MELDDLIKWLQLITLIVVAACGIVLIITVGSLGPTMLDKIEVIVAIIAWSSWL
ncbi:MAG: hypothetical protein ACFFCM_20365 [Promethearchaeota archaeon]